MKSELNHQDLAWCVRRLPRAVLKIMMQAGPTLFLAGGYIRSCITREEIQDVDLFSPSKDTAKNWALVIAERDEKRLHTTDNAFSVKRTHPLVQFIHRWTFERPEDVIASFDFTIASAVIWFEDGNWRSLCHPDYYADLAGKRLVYLSPKREEEAGGSMLRVLKFYQRGYRIPLDSLGAIMARMVVKVEMDKINLLFPEEREWGIAKVLTGLLREVDPSVDPTHAAHLPSNPEQVSETPSEDLPF